MIAILRVCKEPKAPTPIMYATNLSWKPLTAHLKELIHAGLIERVNVVGKNKKTRHIYQTTRTGLKTIEIWDQLKLE